MPRRRVLLPLVDVDRALFDRVAGAHTPWVDRALPALSRSANHSKLWFGLAAGLWAAGGRRGKRAALRGAGSIAVTSAIVNLGVKRAVRRPRPPLRGVPMARRLAAQPLTTSFPSGHAASASAFATGVAAEHPRAAVPIAALAAAVGYSRIYVGVHYPLDVVVGALLGAGVAGLSRLQWPVLPEEADERPATLQRTRVAPVLAGDGLAIVVNRDSGAPLLPSPLSDVQERLPAARVIEVERPDDLPAALEDAARACSVLGICGGDGSAATAAQAAIEHGRPLLVIPGGTLNHLARDLRIERAEDAVAALEHGEGFAVDVAEIDGRPFLNSASFGAYTAMLATREALEKRIGRWPAHVVAVARALFGSSPVELEIDGQRRSVWMVYIGNCEHEPAGFAPSWRPRLDDGLLDVRLLSGEPPWARVRLLASILTGRLVHSVAYERHRVRELRVRAAAERMPLARDGDGFEGSPEFDVRKLARRLVVYAPVHP